ncbi:MAG: zf-HC2 domain-containing protein [Acidobacteriota bacterium]
MTSQTEHPARSAEFLSRLHDGELTPAERARFESHRAHCADCRRAATEFEDALSLYRSSRPGPASPDLAARILRKLQTSTPPRRGRFGPSFGIDLRWAGAFAAAVIASIIGSSIVARYETPGVSVAAPASAPIPVVLGTPRPRRAEVRQAAAPPANGPEDSLAALRTKAVAGEGGAASPPRRPSSREDKRQTFAPNVPEPAPAVALQKSKKLDAQRDRAASAPDPSESPERRNAEDSPKIAAFSQRRAEAPAAAPPAERPGGEGASGASGRLGEAAPPAARVRLVVESMDALRSVPALAPHQSMALLEAWKGRTYLLLIDAGGRVQEALRHGPASGIEADDRRSKDDLTELRTLRFEPGDRPRRVLLRIE